MMQTLTTNCMGSNRGSFDVSACLRLQLLVVIFLSTSLAQGVAQQSQGLADQSQLLPSLYGLEEVQSRTEQAKQPLPDKDSLLNRELERVDNEISKTLSSLALYRSGWKGAKEIVSQVLERLSRHSSTLANLDCKKQQRFVDAVAAYNAEYARIERMLPSLGLDISEIVAIRPPNLFADNESSCASAQEKFGSQEFSNDLKQTSLLISNAASDGSQKADQITTANARYLEALQVRKKEILEKLAATQSAVQIGGSLPTLLFILGVACVSTILGVKLFDKDIQMEWVASGQVIQFVTVMILLSVILALGLSSTLKENTLGTLLGGLAGYVLAQGVGRSAARSAEKAATAAAESKAASTQGQRQK